MFLPLIRIVHNDVYSKDCLSTGASQPLAYGRKLLRRVWLGVDQTLDIGDSMLCPRLLTLAFCCYAQALLLTVLVCNQCCWWLECDHWRLCCGSCRVDATSLWY
jgi:hypothetical protein